MQKDHGHPLHVEHLLQTLDGFMDGTVNECAAPAETLFYNGENCRMCGATFAIREGVHAHDCPIGLLERAYHNFHTVQDSIQPEKSAA